MKQHFLKIFSTFVIFLCTINAAQAALITSNFSDLGGNQWTVDLTLTNDSNAAGINEFTVYFSELLFANLSVVNSPAAWDSFVAQPDLFLNSSGFFDSYSPIALALGSSQGGFTVGFTFLGQGAPGALAFNVLDGNFQLLSSGSTSNAPARVAEPSALWLMILGGLFLLARRTRKTSV
ncbi:hypothetical protein GCM10011613_36650 [Cellvibrio zantedeschiae]|uniref:PEP-CTERM protein-sorting domain-containing protein n=1 Tax=Cellvibrio zantedeschiae TaxID=1237077 RepID=A0ABQ3BDI6_9GAMM|nr:PEP-CTERM sorting domain-containing protein [Cellvibrio zantedeschiae]GGY88274.1 hypothetical protein GCM10011613_36650 [Cellvibrio zantedeschiae]